ncbi:MAG: hypothetical protein HOH43_16875, partial [Candidatus Latescibacteria bacterium]|nr:hypothetical protein [Candidatus Latescibacterota bacterium]
NGGRVLASTATRSFKVTVRSGDQDTATADQLSELFAPLTKGLLLTHTNLFVEYLIEKDGNLALTVRDRDSDQTLERKVPRDLTFGTDELHYLYSEALRLSVRIAPEEPYLVRALADYYISFRRFKEGIAEFRDITSDLPDKPLPHFQLGVIYDRANDLEAAYLAFEQANIRAPGETITMYNLGVTASESGRSAKAEHWFKAVLQKDSGMEKAKRQLELLSRRKNMRAFRIQSPTSNV